MIPLIAIGIGTLIGLGCSGKKTKKVCKEWKYMDAGHGVRPVKYCDEWVEKPRPKAPDKSYRPRKTLGNDWMWNKL